MIFFLNKHNELPAGAIKATLELCPIIDRCDIFNSEVASWGSLKMLKIKPIQKNLFVGNHRNTFYVLRFHMSFFSRIQNNNQKENLNTWGHITAKTM
jgi:hypothetical protein